MKRLQLLLVMVVGLVMLPFSVYASEYNTLDFEGALKEEEIEPKFENYKPNEDAITIYMFRGKGCGYCRAYLEFMNSITNEYGKYFKMETYEVWNDTANAELLDKVSTYLGESAGGVPYIVIGDKVFGGYASQYDDAIKEAITTLYNTKESKRYDVFKEMKKHPNGKDSGFAVDSTVVWNFVFILLATCIIVSYNHLKFKELELKLDKVVTKEYKKNKK
ncbi:MAG: hypothetical protein IKI04_01720 [Bacilli bacterium]|nr:hypothetical protein [Bacilli bacterium]